jgi:hypothetical protein
VLQIGRHGLGKVESGDFWPCPISPDTSDGMMMPGEKDDDTQQKNIH